MDANVITITGRLTRDPEPRTMASGERLAKFSVAVTNYGKDKGTTFFDCSIFGRQAEYVLENLTKGRQVLVTGRHESNKGSNGVTYWELKANQVNGLDRPKDEAQPSANTRTQTTGGADEYDPFADE